MLTSEQKQNMQNLLENLRSGEYTQGHKRLKSDDDEYCCMGVAVKTLGYEFKKLTGTWYYTPESGDRAFVSHEAFLMPPRDAAMFGLDKSITEEESTKIPESSGAATRQDHLVWCNDKEDYSFLEIADEIERMGWDK